MYLLTLSLAADTEVSTEVVCTEAVWAVVCTAVNTDWGPPPTAATPWWEAHTELAVSTATLWDTPLSHPPTVDLATGTNPRADTAAGKH